MPQTEDDQKQQGRQGDDQRNPIERTAVACQQAAQGERDGDGGEERYDERLEHPRLRQEPLVEDSQQQTTREYPENDSDDGCDNRMLAQHDKEGDPDHEVPQERQDDRYEFQLVHSFDYADVGKDQVSEDPLKPRLRLPFITEFVLQTVIRRSWNRPNRLRVLAEGRDGESEWFCVKSLSR